MTGIEKIIKKVEEDCIINCEDIIEKAYSQAQSILDDAKILGEKAKEEAIETTNNKCQTEIELAISRADHERKKSILATKISIINEVIDEAMQKLKNLPDSLYFNAVMILVNRYAQNGLGVLHFSIRDLERMPQDFEMSINEILKGGEKSVVISSEPVSIDGGFVIVYGDIEQNCTFDSLLNSSLDNIKDELYEEIFMRDSI